MTSVECNEKCVKKNAEVASTFLTATLAYAPDESEHTPDFLANLTANEKQSMILVLNETAEFEAYSRGLIKVNLCMTGQWNYSTGMTFYLCLNDTITRLKAEIRKL